jgi:hypothetical protein
MPNGACDPKKCANGRRYLKKKKENEQAKQAVKDKKNKEFQEMQNHIIDDLLRELLRAESLHGPGFPSLEHGYTVLLEEMAELFEEIRKKPAKRSMPNLYKEAIQVAAMGCKVAKFISAIEEKKDQDKVDEFGKPILDKTRVICCKCGCNLPKHDAIVRQTDGNKYCIECASRGYYER